MGIDRIGKGGAAPPPDLEKVGKADKTGAVDEPFSVERSEPTKKTAPVDAARAASPLAQLKSGEIDLDRYLDLKVDEATRALDGMLRSAELADLKKILRDQLASDPTLVDMVKSATGKVPSTPEGE